MKWEKFEDYNAYVLRFKEDFSGRDTFVLVYNGSAYTARCTFEHHILNFDDFLATFQDAEISLVAQHNGTDVVLTELIQSMLNYDDYLLVDLIEKLKKTVAHS